MAPTLAVLGLFTCAKVHLLKFHQFHSAKLYLKGYVRLEHHFFHILETKSLKITKKRGKHFFGDSGKSHSAENPKQSSLLAKQFVSNEKREGFDKNKLEVAWKKRRC